MTDKSQRGSHRLTGLGSSDPDIGRINAAEAMSDTGSAPLLKRFEAEGNDPDLPMKKFGISDEYPALSSEMDRLIEANRVALESLSLSEDGQGFYCTVDGYNGSMPPNDDYYFAASRPRINPSSLPGGVFYPNQPSKSFLIPEASGIASAISDTDSISGYMGTPIAGGALRFGSKLAALLTATESVERNSELSGAFKDFTASTIHGSTSSMLGLLAAKATLVVAAVPASTAIMVGVMASFGANLVISKNMNLRPTLDLVELRSTDFLQRQYDEVGQGILEIQRQISALYPSPWH